MNLKDLQDTPPWDWPNEAGRKLQQVLADRRADASERLIAAELAGDTTVVDDKTVDLLLKVVGAGDEPDALRATAAISLGPALDLADTELTDAGEFEDPDFVPITERAFRKIKDSFRTVYSDESVPKEVRRRILEASVRAEASWHADAIRQAYSSGDRDWMLTAVFAMRSVRGFDDQILEALENPDEEIHFEAVEAAGNWRLDAAWPHVTALVNDPSTPKDLLISAIEAVGNIRPGEAGEVLEDLTHARDEDIAEAAQEAISMAEVMSETEDLEDYEDDEDDEEGEEE